MPPKDKNDEIDQSNDVVIQASKYKTKHKLFKCKICDFETAEKGALKTHIEHVHEGIKPFKCNNWDNKTVKRFILMKHIKSVHESMYQAIHVQHL